MARIPQQAVCIIASSERFALTFLEQQLFPVTILRLICTGHFLYMCSDVSAEIKALQRAAIKYPLWVTAVQ